MFARRLTLALAALAGAAVLEGLAALWALNVANNHVQRGRVASDIELAFKDLTVSKLRLRAWFTQAQLDPDTSRTPGLQHQAAMRATLERLRQLSARAIELDPPSAAHQDHPQRQEALAVLAEAMDELARAANSVRALPPGTQSDQAWRTAGALFDVSRGRDLQRLLADSIAREADAVARERAGADQAMRWMRRLWMGAATAIALAALLLAASFTRALRRPLDALNTGALALQQGDMAHRIPLAGKDEFSVVARSMNAMAGELAEHRAREALARQQLAAQVTARTAELQRALDSLQQVDERRRRLLADISHELRTPTTVILGEAEVALRGRDSPPAALRDALRRIAGTARQLSAVIGDLLTMARSDIDLLVLNRRPVCLRAAVQQAVEQARALAVERGVAVLLLDADATTPVPVLADPQRLHQLLLLLLDNAVRYSHGGGRVLVDCQPGPHGDWSVSISDQGIGIAETDLPRVFERGFRSLPARQHCSEGSGLGLAIGRALARAHGGDIELDSRVGEGSTARLRLPRHDPSDTPHPA